MTDSSDDRIILPESPWGPSGGRRRWTFVDSGEGIGNATSVIRNNVAAAGLGAQVPTCPRWTVLDLLIHVGVVQRWAAQVLGSGPQRVKPDDAALAAGLRAFADPLDWLDEGLVELLNALTRTPVDADVFFFLTNAGESTRDAWARRQCHEATIHGVDAMAARLGSVPRASQMWFTPSLALDGIDELLRSFVPRRSSPLRDDEVRTLAVRPAGGGAVENGSTGWTVTFGPDGASTEPGASVEAQATITGSPVALYLALWNRGDEFEVAGEAAVVETFRKRMKVAW